MNHYLCVVIQTIFVIELRLIRYLDGPLKGGLSTVLQPDDLWTRREGRLSTDSTVLNTQPGLACSP